MFGLHPKSLRKKSVFVVFRPPTSAWGVTPSPKKTCWQRVSLQKVAQVEHKRRVAPQKVAREVSFCGLSPTDFGVWSDPGSEKHVGKGLRFKKSLKSNKNGVMQCVKKLQTSISRWEIQTRG
jgi:hypothetical protein